MSANRDVKASKAFFRKALKTQGRAPVNITLDGYAASHRAVRELPEQSPRWKDTRLRSSRYLNNMVEQDHRGVKSRIKPMLTPPCCARALKCGLRGTRLQVYIRPLMQDFGPAWPRWNSMGLLLILQADR